MAGTTHQTTDATFVALHSGVHLQPGSGKYGGRSSLDGAVSALQYVVAAPSILAAIRRAPTLTAAVAGTVWRPASETRDLLLVLRRAIEDRDDTVAAIASVHALAAVCAPAAHQWLADLMDWDHESLAAHAAWAVSRQPMAGPLISPLTALVARGGIGGMHAQAALERWSRSMPGPVTGSLRAAMGRTSDVASRVHLTETLGLVAHASVTPDLIRAATDADEPDAVRVAAIAALGDRGGQPLDLRIQALARVDGPIGDVARLAVLDQHLQARQASAGSGRGLHIAQIHLGSTMDADLRRSGAGDTGGIATLLVKLGDALARTDAVDRVVTIGRGTAEDALVGAHEPTSAHHFMPAPLEANEHSSLAAPWPARVAAERGIRRAFLVHGRPDIVHLRMADAGTLAAANVAGMLDIRTAFSLAPDPHALMAAREAGGDLDRRTFSADDGRQQLWYRVDLVDRMARAADDVVLFPRQHLAAQIRNLVGVDVQADPDRFSVVPEGIDVGQIVEADRAVTSTARHPAPGPDDLRRRIAALPVERHGLPVIISAGRLNELKGMARLVTAFAADPSLQARANLVIVGGDLAHPSADERTELERINEALHANPAAAGAVILFGHRPNRQVVELLAAARRGFGAEIGPHGAYVSASYKEEFGLAIVEALAAGLPVVAPREGGPGTYVDEGRTGFLIDTADQAALTRAIDNALDIADEPGRAEATMSAIRSKYDITSMAVALAKIYARELPSRSQRLAS
ncbi:MAG: glycosyltransferase [Candidatus Limnocylindria bacterium]